MKSILIMPHLYIFNFTIALVFVSYVCCLVSLVMFNTGMYVDMWMNLLKYLSMDEYIALRFFIFLVVVVLQYMVIYGYYYSLMDTRDANKYSTSTRVWDMMKWTSSKNKEEVWDNVGKPLTRKNILAQVGKKGVTLPTNMVMLSWFSKALGQLKFKYDRSDWKWIGMDSIVSKVNK